MLRVGKLSNREFLPATLRYSDKLGSRLVPCPDGF